LDFICDRCGLCCRALNQFGSLYSDLDDGSGCCRYLDKKSNLCSIYDNRPLKCRIEEGYKTYFSEIPYKQYIEQTIKGCNKLKEQSKKMSFGKKRGAIPPLSS